MNAPKTHHALKSSVVAGHGHRSPAMEERLHVSWTCANCAHFARVIDPATNTDQSGVCVSDVYPEGQDFFCGGHQTLSESKANIRRIDRPAFSMMKGRPHADV